MNSFLIVPLLGLTQLIDYGTLYHSFSVLAPSMAKGLGWPVEWVFGVLSAAFLLSGLVTPYVGRRVDRYGAGRVMLLGTLASAVTLTLCALLPGHLAFVVTVVAIQLALTMVQYSVAFSFLVQLNPLQAQRHISWLSLFMGLASTVFWPITASLHAAMTWEQVYLLFAGLHVAVCFPLLVLLVTSARRTQADRAGPPAPGGGGAETEMEAPPAMGRVEGVLQPRYHAQASALMIAGFAFQSFVLAALFIHLLPLFYAIGLGQNAVAIAMLLGPAQLLSRSATIALGDRLSQLMLAIISALLPSLALLILLVAMPHAAGAAAFAIVFGLGSGLGSIAIGTLPLALFGSAGYGARAGTIGSARLIVSSAAPFIFSLLMEQAGLGWALAVMAGLGIVSVFSFLAIARLLRRQAADGATATIKQVTDAVPDA